MFCFKCGKKLLDGESYCQNCGAKAQDYDILKQAQKYPLFKIITTITIALVILFAIYGIIIALPWILLVLGISIGVAIAMSIMKNRKKQY